MNTRRIEFSVGLFVLVGLVAVAVLAIRIGGGRIGRPDTREIGARFTNANGLKKGSSVRISGVTIGDVTSVSLKPDDMSALVMMRVDASLKLDDDTIASVRSSGLIGERFISLKPGSSGTALKTGAIIVDTESAVDLEDIIARFAFGSVDKK
ncbi:MAG TPA: outer membrane lipid asymmetry maintenance protein MlaD [Opitutaceae bacterium]|nr:outer membrane lipid asymmetry maintenance protein MlaD [Opitutaceae bacterium]